MRFRRGESSNSDWSERRKRLKESLQDGVTRAVQRPDERERMRRIAEEMDKDSEDTPDENKG